jgi:hypothetical protein
VVHQAAPAPAAPPVVHAPSPAPVVQHPVVAPVIQRSTAPAPAAPRYMPSRPSSSFSGTKRR